MDRLSLWCSLLALLFATSAQAQYPQAQYPQAQYPQAQYPQAYGSIVSRNDVDGYTTLTYSTLGELSEPPSFDQPVAPNWFELASVSEIPAESPVASISSVNTVLPLSPVSSFDQVPCPETRPRRWVRRFRVGAGFEFGWFQPRFSDNVSAVVTRTSGNRTLAFNHPTVLTPRIWVGIENARGLGLRARYWDLSSEAPTQVLFPVAGATPISFTIDSAGGQFTRTAVANVGDALTSDHRIKMRTIDFEGTQRFLLGRTNMLASFGLRYAKTNQRAHAVVTDGTGSLTQLACQYQRFEGFGPTASLAMTRCLFGLGWMQSRVSFWADTRGSILFGQQEQEIVLVTGGGSGLAEDDYVQDDFLPIMELGGGLQLRARPLGRGYWTVRTGYRAESWFGVGGPVNTTSNIGLGGMILSLDARW